jgi:hypothetical protein
MIPLEYMHIDGWRVSLTDMINIAKYNNTIKHCTFAPDIIKNLNCGYYNKIKPILMQDLINEIPSIIDLNPNIESLEFIYDGSIKNMNYFDFVSEILSQVANSDVNGNIKPLIFFSKLLRPTSSIRLSAKIFIILNKFKCLRSIDIRMEKNSRVEIYLKDLLIALADNQTIQTITLDNVDNISDKIFTDTNFLIPIRHFVT